MASELNLRAINNDQLRDLYREVMDTDGWTVELTRSNHVVMTGPFGKTFGPLTTSDGARVAKNVRRQLKGKGWDPTPKKKSTVPRVEVQPDAVITVEPTFQHGVLEYEKPEPEPTGVTPMAPSRRGSDVLAKLRGEEPPPEEIPKPRGVWADSVTSLTRGLKVESPPKQRPRGRAVAAKKRAGNPGKRSDREMKAYNLLLDLVLTAATEHPDQWVRVPGKHPYAVQTAIRKVAKELNLKVRIRIVNTGNVSTMKLPKGELSNIKVKYWIKVTDPSAPVDDDEE